MLRYSQKCKVMSDIIGTQQVISKPWLLESGNPLGIVYFTAWGGDYITARIFPSNTSSQRACIPSPSAEIQGFKMSLEF